MFVVAGTSGHTGAVVAETLLAKGEKVRVLARDASKAAKWKEKGAEIAIADIGDAAALGKALAGAKGFYTLLPPILTSNSVVADQAKRIDAMAKAIQASKTPHVVFLSSAGADHPSGTGPIVSLHHAEKALSAVTALTPIRAAYFMENWGGSLGALKDGILPTFIQQDAQIPMVATHDIGTTAANALLAGPKGKIELAGPREYSAKDVAAILSKLVGREIKVQQGQEEAIAPTFKSFGMSDDMARLYHEMIHAFNAGQVRWEGTPVRGSTTIDKVLAQLLGK